MHYATLWCRIYQKIYWKISPAKYARSCQFPEDLTNSPQKKEHSSLGYLNGTFTHKLTLMCCFIQYYILKWLSLADLLQKYSISNLFLTRTFNFGCFFFLGQKTMCYTQDLGSLRSHSMRLMYRGWNMWSFYIWTFDNNCTIEHLQMPVLLNMCFHSWQNKTIPLNKFVEYLTSYQRPINEVNVSVIFVSECLNSWYVVLFNGGYPNRLLIVPP